MGKINIGIANLIVSDLLKESFFNKNMINESRKITFDFIDIIKNSPILQLEFKVMNNIENKTIKNDTLASRYIDNNIKLFETYTLEELEKEHNKLEKYYKEEINIDKNKAKLYESISNLIEESISDYENIDVDIIHESFEYILEHIKNPKIIENKNEEIEQINEDVIAIAIGKFNEKYNNQMNEQDLNLFKKLTTSNYNEKIQLLEEYKQKNINILNKINGSNNNPKINQSIEKINEMVSKPETIDSNIINLYELNKGLI